MEQQNALANVSTTVHHLLFMTVHLWFYCKEKKMLMLDELLSDKK